MGDEIKINALERNKKVLTIMQLLILHCQKPNDEENKCLIIARNVFLKSIIKSYKQCQSNLKIEYPSLILSILYHLFGQTLSTKKKTMSTETLSECFLDLRDVCIDSLASRMQSVDRLNIFKLIQLSLQFEGYEWFKNSQNDKKQTSMNSEKLMLFVLSSV